MPVIMYFDGPEPPIGRIWCGVCVMLAKQAAITAERERILALQSAEGPPVRIKMDLGGAELEPAVTRAISTVVPQWGMMDVCWSHVLGLELLPSGVAPASPQEAAMISQAVRMDQRKGGRG